MIYVITEIWSKSNYKESFYMTFTTKANAEEWCEIATFLNKSVDCEFILENKEYEDDHDLGEYALIHDSGM